MIPIRLCMSITLIAAITGLVAFASYSYSVSHAEHQIEHACQVVQSSLSTLIESGVPRDLEARNAPNGTQRVLTMMLPESLVYLSFGGNPDPLNTGQFQSSLTQDGAAVFYRVQGGSSHVQWLPVDTYKFREGVLQNNTWEMDGAGSSYIIHHGGSTSLVFELVQKNQVQYILIHANDGIE